MGNREYPGIKKKLASNIGTLHLKATFSGNLFACHETNPPIIVLNIDFK